MAEELVFILLGLSILGAVHSRDDRCTSDMCSGPEITIKENANGYLSQAQKDAILDRHNEYRRLANAKNMNMLTWNDKLAEMSDKAAAHCKFEHTKISTFGRHWHYGGNYGENIYGSKGLSTPADYPVFKWWAEIKDYNLTTRGLTDEFAGLQIGHYTQVVWATTTSVGCGVRRCAKVEFPIKSGGKIIGWRYENNDPYWVVFCQYHPPGNYKFVAPFVCNGPEKDCNWKNKLTPRYIALGKTKSLNEFVTKSSTQNESVSKSSTRKPFYSCEKDEDGCEDAVSRKTFADWICKHKEGHKDCCLACRAKGYPDP